MVAKAEILDADFQKCLLGEFGPNAVETLGTPTVNTLRRFFHWGSLAVFKKYRATGDAVQDLETERDMLAELSRFMDRVKAGER